MQTKKNSIEWIIFITILLGLVGWYLYKNTIKTITIPQSQTPVEVKNENKAEPLSYLKVPEGFAISIFAKDVPDARVMEFDDKGRIIVSQPSQGTVSVLADTDSDGISDQKTILIKELKNPHGLSLNCHQSACSLWVAEQNALDTFEYNSEKISVSNKIKVADLESSPTDRHSTRSLLYLDTNTMLISVGSSCNVCNESGEQRAKILAYNFGTGKLSEYAKGLRNSVFMVRDYVHGKIYATEMGRDGLGDNIPPDEINIIEKDKNYGWPNCYGKNIHDTDFDKNTYIRNPCMEPLETESFVDLPAHSAPLSLGFIPEEGWPESYWYNMLVAYHGSWNRTTPTGYKIVRVKMDSKGKYLGTEDFVTGWLTADGKKLGRPVDIKIVPGGTAYISDDQNGVIYRLYKTKE